MWNAVNYFETLNGKLKATQGNYKFCRVSGLNGLEDILTNFSSANAFLAIDDTDDGATLQIGGSFFNRRSFVVYVLKKYDINNMVERETVLNETRAIYTNLISKLILDQQNVPELAYLDKSKISFYEVPGYFAAGTTGLYFIFSVDEPINLVYDEKNWGKYLSESNYSVGQLVEGGIIAYILNENDTDYNPLKQKGLVISENDLGLASYRYTDWNYDMSKHEDINTAWEYGTGAANTLLLLNAPENSAEAAKKCNAYRGGDYSDWFLPSGNELYCISLSKMFEGICWSSSNSPEMALQEGQAMSFWATVININNDATTINQQFMKNKVRACRYFEIDLIADPQ